jgi:hypothetical protein
VYRVGGLADILVPRTAILSVGLACKRQSKLPKLQAKWVSSRSFGSNKNGFEGCFLSVVSAAAQKWTLGVQRLSLLYLLLSTLPEQIQHLKKVVSILELRVSTMNDSLATILADDSYILGGGVEPLAHGIIHSLHLVADRKDIFPRWRKVSVEQFQCRSQSFLIFEQAREWKERNKLYR